VPLVLLDQRVLLDQQVQLAYLVLPVPPVLSARQVPPVRMVSLGRMEVPALQVHPETLDLQDPLVTLDQPAHLAP